VLLEFFTGLAEFSLRGEALVIVKLLNRPVHQLLQVLRRCCRGRRFWCRTGWSWTSLSRLRRLYRFTKQTRHCLTESLSIHEFFLRRQNNQTQLRWTTRHVAWNSSHLSLMANRKEAR
jgi:hypothetical protein